MLIYAVTHVWKRVCACVCVRLATLRRCANEMADRLKPDQLRIRAAPCVASHEAPGLTGQVCIHKCLLQSDPFSLLRRRLGGFRGREAALSGRAQ